MKKEIEIDGITYIRKDAINENNFAADQDGMKPVLIRSYGAGVHFGYLKSELFTDAGKVVTLVNSRRVYYWSGAASLSQMAVEGVKNPNDCKFSVTIPLNEIVNVIETIPLSETAFNNLLKVPLWKN